MSEKKEKKSKKPEEEPELEQVEKEKKKKKKKSKDKEREKEEEPAQEEEKESLSKEERKAKRKLEKQKEKEEEEEEEASSKKPQIEVHTANNWEEADLGNDERKLKFLKLMGATKHKDDHQVEHKHARAKTEIKKIDEDLEKQFNEGLHSKFNRAHHQGLGFDTKVESKAYTKASNTRVKFGDNDEPAVVEESKPPAPAPASETKKPAAEDNKLKFKKMVFVKSSS